MAVIFVVLLKKGSQFHLVHFGGADRCQMQKTFEVSPENLKGETIWGSETKGTMMSMNFTYGHSVNLSIERFPITSELDGLYLMAFDRSGCSFEPFFKGTLSPTSHTLSLVTNFFHNMGKHFANQEARLETSRNYSAHSQRRERNSKALHISTSTARP